jgi:hypothetical protein
VGSTASFYASPRGQPCSRGWGIITLDGENTAGWAVEFCQDLAAKNEIQMSCIS